MARTDGKLAKIALALEPEARTWLARNPGCSTLENLRLVAAHLEGTWILKMEDTRAHSGKAIFPGLVTN